MNDWIILLSLTYSKIYYYRLINTGTGNHEIMLDGINTSMLIFINTEKITYNLTRQ
jgi:hypothetical protein